MENNESAGQTRGKVGWICSYTPEEIIYAAGFMPFRLLPLDEPAGTADKLLPPNICPYIRQVARNVEACGYGELEGLVIANSCNAMTHLYNVLKDRNDFFVYLLDLPRRQGRAAEDYFAVQLQEMVEYLGGKGEPVSEERLGKAMELYAETEALMEQLTGGINKGFSGAGLRKFYDLAREAVQAQRGDFNRKLREFTTSDEFGSSPQCTKNGAYIMLTGAIPTRPLIEMLAGDAQYPVVPENCSGTRYFFSGRSLDGQGSAGGDQRPLYNRLASYYLQKPPCPRLFPHEFRQHFLHNSLISQVNIKGIIFHDLGFCDLSHYDYLQVKEISSDVEVPLLKLETDMSQGDAGRLRTRLEAFLEMID